MRSRMTKTASEGIEMTIACYFCIGPSLRVPGLVVLLARRRAAGLQHLLEHRVAHAAHGLVLGRREVAERVVVPDVRRQRVSVLVHGPLAALVTGVMDPSARDRQQPTDGHSQLGRVGVARAHVLGLQVLPLPVHVEAVGRLRSRTGRERASATHRRRHGAPPPLTTVPYHVARWFGRVSRLERPKLNII